MSETQIRRGAGPRRPCDLQPAGRFDWERIVRRYPMPPTIKLIALLAATYGDRHGGRVRPGVARLVAVSGTSRATVKRALGYLRDQGFLEEVLNGSRAGNGRASVFQLTLPDDLLERGLLPPDELPDQGSPVSPGDPVDNSGPGLTGEPWSGPAGGGPGLMGEPDQGSSRADQGSSRARPGLTGEPRSVQDQISDHPEIKVMSPVGQRARAQEDDDQRRYATASAELRRLPDFGLALIEEVRRALPGEPTYTTQVITAGELARERRKTGDVRR